MGVTSPAPAPARRRALPWVIAALAVLLAGGALAFVLLRDDAPPAAAPAAATTSPPAPVPVADPFTFVQKTCDPTEEGTTIGDGGRTLVIDGTLGVDKLACVLAAMGTPESVKAQVESTRALDGRQEAAWEGYSMSWTYHPDSGLNAIVTAA